jgi:prolyl 4-hydroxylase
MKLQVRTVTFLLLLPSSMVIVTGADLDVDNPYAFHMIEDAERCKSVFKSEQTLLVPILHNLRESFADQLRTIQNIVKNSSLLKKSDLDSVINLGSSWKETARESIDNATVDFPTEIDFKGATSALVTLQNTYLFDPFELSEGKLHLSNYARIGGEFTIIGNHNFTWPDLYSMATFAYGKRWYDSTVYFLNAVFRLIPLVPKRERPDKTTYREMLAMRREVVQWNNKYLSKTRMLADSEHQILPYFLTDKLEKAEKQPDHKKPIEYANLGSEEGKQFYFRSVCNGFSFREYMGIVHTHHCHYLHHNNPFLKLGPFKIEVASKKPFVIVFHDLLSDKEMNYMVDISRPNLSRGRHVEAANTGNAKHEYKSGKKTKIVAKSVQHWIEDIYYEEQVEDPMAPDNNYNYTIKDDVMFHLSKKLERATGLNLTRKYASTQYQTTNYGLGGLCETHIDPHGYLEGVEIPLSRKMLVRTGDMLATVMAWISKEPVGGATAFISPMKEITVWPTKGSAAFWYDVDKKGYRDRDTLHGGCPVLQGTKWILNKWIYYFDQWPKYSCSLDPSEKIDGFTGLY